MAQRRHKPKHYPQERTQPPETILARLDHRFGSEVLIRLATGACALELIGFASDATQALLSIDPDASQRRRVTLDREKVRDWSKAQETKWPAH